MSGVRSVSREPSALITWMSCWPKDQVNRILVPSGDQSGENLEAESEGLVRTVSVPLPSTLILMICGNPLARHPSNTICVPAGFQLGRSC